MASPLVSPLNCWLTTPPPAATSAAGLSQAPRIPLMMPSHLSHDCDCSLCSSLLATLADLSCMFAPHYIRSNSSCTTPPPPPHHHHLHACLCTDPLMDISPSGAVDTPPLITPLNGSRTPFPRTPTPVSPPPQCISTNTQSKTVPHPPACGQPMSLGAALCMVRASSTTKQAFFPCQCNLCVGCD